MSDISVGMKYTHEEDNCVVTVTQVKQKQLGTPDKPIYRTTVEYTIDSDGTRMSTEQTLFQSRYHAI